MTLIITKIQSHALQLSFNISRGISGEGGYYIVVRRFCDKANKMFYDTLANAGCKLAGPLQSLFDK